MAGLSSAELARLVNYNQSTVSRWESNASRPTRDAPGRLVEVLGLDPDVFYRALGTTPTPPSTADVESAVRADTRLTPGQKTQLLSLYAFFLSGNDTRDRDERYLDARLDMLPDDRNVTEGDVTQSPCDTPKR